MVPQDDSMVVFLEDEAAPLAKPERQWKVLVADDDDEVHTISRLVLRDFRFEGRGLNIIGAHSGEEAKRMVADNPDAAVLLLDVVMESDGAGLEVVRHIRQVLGNWMLRIILRTGQPGQAPERSVVIDYDINDYKEKTELTAQKLVTSLVSALRAYRDIQIIDNSRRGLEKVIQSSANLFEPQSLSRFSAGVLQQLTALLNLDGSSLYIHASGFAARCDDGLIDHYRILAGTHSYADAVGLPISEVVPPALRAKLDHAVSQRRTVIDGDSYIGYFRTSNGSDNLVYLQICQPLSPLDVDLLHVFSTNLAVAFDNVYLNDEMVHTQAELINTLSDVVESRSKETGLHVFRVGESAQLLGRLVGLPERDCELLRMVAPMHDLGKIGIEDALLKKPSQLSPAEMGVMRQHTQIGYNILKGSNRLPLRSAALIAHQHHEWWNGEGYPQGLKGDEIHIFGRVVALVDVFDALSHDRCYKAAWRMAEVIDYIRDGRGTQFDPRLVDAFLANVAQFTAIYANYPERQLVDA